MTTALRNTGIEPVGEIPWGTHFCHFYETRDDLLETLLPFFRAGLEAGEFCAWVVSEPLTEEEVWQALDRAVPGFDRYVSDQCIEVLNARDVYLAGGEIDLHRIISNWRAKLERALSRGYQGIRVSGNTAWLEQKQWRDFMEYETELNRGIGDQPMVVLCTYPLTTSGATEFLDVAGTHQFAVAKRRGRWEVVETPQLTQAKAEIVRLNRDLEQRVRERTTELEAAIGDQKRASEALQEAQKSAGARYAAHHRQRADRIAGPRSESAARRHRRKRHREPALARAHSARSQRRHGGDAASDPGRRAGGRGDRACACAREEVGRGEVSRGPRSDDPRGAQPRPARRCRSTRSWSRRPWPRGFARCWETGSDCSSSS